MSAPDTPIDARRLWPRQEDVAPWQGPPACRGCERIAHRDWRSYATYEPVTHTYLCQACRPRPKLRPKLRIAITCRGCGVMHEWAPSVVRDRQKRGLPGRWAVDVAAGTGTYLCKRCLLPQDPHASPSQGPPTCRGCGRGAQDRWRRYATYEPTTHTYLCPSCRPRPRRPAARRPACRTCGRIAAVAWRSYATYEHETHTYLCRPCQASAPRTRVPPITLTCRGCRVVVLRAPGVVRMRQKQAPPGRIVVDTATGVGTFVCRSCSGTQRLNAHRARLRQRLGRERANRRIAAGAARWREAEPEQWAATIQKSVAATHARRGQPHTIDDRQRAAASLGGLKLEPNGRLGLCALCDRLLYTHASQLARRPHDGDRSHRLCVLAWRRETRQRPGTWPPSSSRPGRGRSDAELRVAYQTTVRYLKLKHPTKGPRAPDLDAYGAPIRTVDQLARTLGVTPSQLYRRVERFLAVLPDEALAVGKVGAWRRIFLTLEPPAPGV